MIEQKAYEIRMTGTLLSCLSRPLPPRLPINARMQPQIQRTQQVEHTQASISPCFLDQSNEGVLLPTIIPLLLYCFRQTKPRRYI